LKTKFQIFVSSTYEDLKSERDAVIKAILEMGHIPVGMEMFSAGDEEQWTLIQRQIDDCDYYVVLLAHKYGSKDGSLSYTEKEYDYAVSKNMPTLGFVIHDTAVWSKTKMDTDSADQAALASFKTKVKQKMVAFWKSADDLNGKVAIALSKAFNTHPRPGWVRTTANLSPAVTNELSRLSEENARLRAALKVANATVKIDEENRRRKVLQALNNQQRTIPLAFKEEKTYLEQKSTTLFDIFYEAAPLLLVENSAKVLNKAIAVLLRHKDFHPDRHLRAETAIPLNYVQGWLGDFMALDLLEPSTKKHSVSDTDQYWTLSDFGKSIYKFIRTDILLQAPHSDSTSPTLPSLAPAETPIVADAKAAGHAPNKRP
jgi:hypothetical protein